MAGERRAGSSRSMGEAGRERPVGLTRDVGWEIGASRTLEAPIEEVWALLTSAEGLAIWLGPGVAGLPEPVSGTGDDGGGRVVGDGGATGEVRSVRRLDRIRLRWQPAGAEHASTVQVAVRPGGPVGGRARTMVRFHEEHLRSAAGREARRQHWQGVLGRLQAHVADHS